MLSGDSVGGSEEFIAQTAELHPQSALHRACCFPMTPTGCYGTPR